MPGWPFASIVALFSTLLRFTRFCVEKNLAKNSARGEKMTNMRYDLPIRAGPQNEKWSDRQKTENPTGSIHKEVRKKKFDPKKVDFD